MAVTSVEGVEQVLSAHRKIMLQDIWPAGRNAALSPPDGGHFCPVDASRPVSASRRERHVLFELAYRLGGDVLEIGTGFGVSTLCIAAGLAAHGSGRVVTIDRGSEGEKSQALGDMATTLLTAAGLTQLVTFIAGSSPADVGEHLAPTGRFAWAFIDADHNGDAPVNDFEAAQACLAKPGVVAFHDYDLARYTVHLGVAKALTTGLRYVTVLPTSCSLAVCSDSLKPIMFADEALEVARAAELAES